MLLRLLLLMTVALGEIAASAQAIPDTVLFATDGVEADFFGWSVAVGQAGGDTLVAFVGLPNDYTIGPGYRPGTVHSFFRVDDNWVYDATLEGFTVDDAAHFGRSIALALDPSGQYPHFAVVGAPFDNVTSLGTEGTAHAFRYYEDFGWQLDGHLIASDHQSDDFLGLSVAISRLPSGEIVVLAGAAHEDDVGPASGAAYVFVRNPTTGTWAEEAKLLPTNTGGTYFGTSVALIPKPGAIHIGDALAIIAAEDGSQNVQPVYAFVRDGETSTWQLEAELPEGSTARYSPRPETPSQHNATTLFDIRGVAVSSLPGGDEGEALVVAGVPFSDCGASNSGTAYVFRRRSDGVGGFIWEQEDLLCPHSPLSQSRIGSSVAIHSAAGRPVRALIGTDPNTTSEGHPGAADLFERNPDTGSWAFVEHFETGLSGFDGADWFGHSVALTSDQVFVGAYGSDAGGVNASGAVYVYSPFVVASEPDAPADRSSLSVYPNPAAESMTVTFHLPEAQAVRIALYDVLGREVAVLHDEMRGRGSHTIPVNTTRLVPGPYVARVVGEDVRLARAFTVIR